MSKVTLAEIQAFNRQHGITNNYANVHDHVPPPASGKQWATDDILDTDDVIYESANRLRRIVRREFKSLPSNPHTKIIDIAMGQRTAGMDVPQTGIENMMEEALRYHEKDLTKRQKQAMEAYDEAIHTDKPPVMYVAEKLGIDKSNASRLLKRAKIATFSDFVHYVSSSEYQLGDWSPSPKQIKSMMKSKPRTCAYCGGETYDGSVPLCFVCHSKLKSLREEVWDKRTRSWLPDEIRRIENEHRAWAVDQCYKQYYGVVDSDISDLEDTAQRHYKKAG
jgi:ribosome-binding ATPase YchF (GTP1/OBG family)